MKTHVLMVSRTFPSWHPKKGQPTYFLEKILRARNKRPKKQLFIQHGLDYSIKETKIHTIRSNFDFWHKRISDIHYGGFELSLRYWEGMPYKSRQIELLKIPGKDLSLQKLIFIDGDINRPTIAGNGSAVFGISPDMLSENDGLTLEDWKQWFINYDLTVPFAIIKFVKK